MKVLYISPENTVGTLGSWRKIHAARGNECRTITFFPSDMGFEDDICLNLPLVGTNPAYRRLRDRLYRRTRGPLGEETLLEGNPPYWEPGNAALRSWFAMRDRLWRWWVEPAIRTHQLLDFDVYHLEWGMEFYRNGSFVKRLAERGKALIATYHGQDFRNRGVIRAVDEHVQISLTSEYDLVPRHPNLHYLYLPYDVAAVQPRTALNDPLVFCHATRNRHVKGSDCIIDACRALERSHGIRFILIENQPHDVTMKLKAEADVYVDQVADVAPGFGMNSIETMAMGVACCTTMNAEYERFMPDHPFINVSRDNLLAELTALVEQPGRIVAAGRAARKWAEDKHGLKAVGDQLYAYYMDIGAPLS